MKVFKIKFPGDYAEDNLFQFEIEAKGYLQNVSVILEDCSYSLVFYDIVRLYQDTKAEIEYSGYFFESNLILVSKVTKKNMIEAVDSLFRRGEIQFLKEDIR